MAQSSSLIEFVHQTQHIGQSPDPDCKLCRTYGEPIETKETTHVGKDDGSILQTKLERGGRGQTILGNMDISSLISGIRIDSHVGRATKVTLFAYGINVEALLTGLRDAEVAVIVESSTPAPAKRVTSRR